MDHPFPLKLPPKDAAAKVWPAEPSRFAASLLGLLAGLPLVLPGLVTAGIFARMLLTPRATLKQIGELWSDGAATLITVIVLFGALVAFSAVISRMGFAMVRNVFTQFALAASLKNGVAPYGIYADAAHLYVHLPSSFKKTKTLKIRRERLAGADWRYVKTRKGS